MNVEFIGLPGSGKTTLRRRLLSYAGNSKESRLVASGQAYLDVARVKIDNVFRLPLRVLPDSLAIKFCMRVGYHSSRLAESQVEFLANYGCALAAFTGSATYRDMSVLDRTRVIGSFLEAGAFRQFLSDPKDSDRVIVFEEGLVQKSFMFVDHAPDAMLDEERIVEYLDNIPLPDLLVYVRASIAESEKRMVTRPDGLTQRLRHADHDSIRRFLIAAEAHLDIVSRWLSDRQPRALYMIDNSDGMPADIDKLKQRIESL